MRNEYVGRIGAIILLSVISMQNVYAQTQTFTGNWYDSMGSAEVKATMGIGSFLSTEMIWDPKYNFYVAEDTYVEIRLRDSTKSSFVYLIKRGQNSYWYTYQIIGSKQGSVGEDLDVYKGNLSEGNYFVVVTTPDAKETGSFKLDFTFNPSNPNSAKPTVLALPLPSVRIVSYTPSYTEDSAGLSYYTRVAEFQVMDPLNPGMQVENPNGNHYWREWFVEYAPGGTFQYGYGYIYLSQQGIDAINKGNTLDRLYINVRNNYGSTYATILPTVVAVDDPAQFSGDTSGVGNVNTAINGSLIAQDEEGLSGDYFSIMATPSNGTATINQATGDWQYQPNTDFSGADQFTIRVTDVTGAPNDQAISLKVSNPTLFSGDTNGTGNEDNPISGTLVASDMEGLSGDYFAISVNSSHGTATINPSSGDWQYVPNANYFGADTFTVTVTDDDDVTSTQVISITVNPVDDVAQFSGNTNGTGDEDNVISGTLTATDVDGLTDESYFTVTADPLQGTAAINLSSGDWQYSPNDNVFGEDAFTVTVTDDLGGTSTQIISVTINSVDDTTVFTGDLEGTGNEDNDITGRLEATDVEGLTDGSYFTVTATPQEGTATINSSSGDWVYTPPANYFGADTFTVTVTDDAGATSTQVISITVNSVDDVAQFSGDLNGTGDEDSDISGVLSATDVEGLSGDYFAISVNSLQGTATINQATDEWQYSPNANYFGADQFTLTVTDDLGGVSSQLIDISVTPINDAPTITSTEITAATENQLYSYTVTTNDVEADTVSLRASNIPGWLSFDQSTGVLTGTPLHAHVGENAIEIEADDGTVTISHIFAITVADVNNLPTIELTVNNFIEDAGGLVANMSEAASYVVEDLDGDELTVTFEEGTNSNNHYVLDTAQQKILLTQVAIDLINSGNALDTISLRVTDNYTNQSSTPDVSNSNESELDFFDSLNIGLEGVIEEATAVENPSQDSSSSSDSADSETTTTTSSGSDSGVPSVTVKNDLPQGAVTINGTIAQGETLTARNDLSDQEGLGPISYQWQADSENIVDANESTYELTQNEVGKVITVIASYTDNQGTEESVTSAPTIAVANINDNPEGVVSISGTATQGEQLTADNTLSDIDGLGDISYQWQAEGEDITDADQSTYLLTQNEVGKTITVIASYTDKQGTEESVTSDPTIAVANINDLPVGGVIISGIVAQGQTLTASNTLTDADGLGAISYQWQADGENITEADQSTYLLTQNDVNKTITVIASYTDDYDMDESVESINSSSKILELALSQLAEDTKNNTDKLYVAAGITGITDANIGSINDALDSEVSDILDAVSVEDQLQIQQLVDSYTNILDFAFDDTKGINSPVIEDYSNIGITGLSDDITVISLLSDVIALGDKEAVDTLTKLQALVNAALSAIEQTENLSKDQLELMGIETVTDDHLPTIRQIIASDPQAMDKVEKIQAVANKVVASHIIQAYSADSANSRLPVLTDYENLGLTNIVASNIDRANVVIVEQDPSAIDTIEKITALLTLDTDADTVEDVFDSFPNDVNETKDSDADNIGDNGDNCPNVANTNQADFDADLLGDACDPDEDNDGVASAEDAFKLNPNYSSDTDGDGMADAFETKFGFDVHNSADKDSDSDGDGVSNLDEFLADTDPRVNPSPGLPQLNIPDDIVITSTGRLTAVDLGEATAKDISQVAIQPVPSVTSPFYSGRHEITWSATDTQGNKSKAVQVVKVIPLANLTPSSISVEDSEIEVKVVISGNAADYPVEIPYTISGSATRGVDYRVLDDTGLLTIEKGREGSFTIEILPDEELENDETIEVTLNTPTNAELGSVTDRTITIAEGNVPPQISVVVEQAGNIGRIIARDKGEVRLTATVTDPNPEDSLTFNWNSLIAEFPGSQISVDSTGKKIFMFDPSRLVSGIHSIMASASDNGNPISTTRLKIDLRLLEIAPTLVADVDSDGDGISDSDEGYSDSDGDGIVDYMDNISEPNLAPVGEDSSMVMQAPVGTKIILGQAAFTSTQNSVKVTKQQLIGVISERQLSLSEGILDEEYSYPNGLYDFVVTGEIPGESYYLVLPLETAVLEGQVFRKYMGPDNGWQAFKEDANNTLFSAAAIDGACPEPGSDIFVSDIQAGHNCIQLYIEDGGPNDFDASENGRITDPGGVAIFNKREIAPSAEYSRLELSQTFFTNFGKSATVTITAVGADKTLLDNMIVSAECKQCSGVTIDKFIGRGEGVYTANLTYSSAYSNGLVEAVISNKLGSVTVGPTRLIVMVPSGGGCTIGSGQGSDISLLLILILLTLIKYRRKLSKTPM